MISRYRINLAAAPAVCAALLAAGCGGSGGAKTDQGEHEMTLGSLVTRMVGTSQPPVTASGFGAVVTGVAGASVTSLVVNASTPGLETTRIAFAAGGDIFTMSSDGNGIINLTRGAAGNCDSPSWSPDGTRITFHSLSNGKTRIFAMSADGSGVTALTLENGSNPAWSPDGKRIAFISNRDGSNHIFLMNQDGTAVTRITSGSTDEHSISWSPDGRKLSFIRTGDPKVPGAQVWITKSDGTAQRAITSPSVFVETAWSPDGSKILASGLGSAHFDVFTIAPDGSGFAKLPNSAGVNEFNPSWSPDGQRIAFQDGDVYVMNAGGGSATRLTSLGNVTNLNWGPPARSITLIGTGAPLATSAAGFLFSTNGTTVTSIVAVDATSRSATRVSAQTGQSTTAPNIVFNVDAADSLTRLQYMNTLVGPPTTVIGPGAPVTTATNALVSFSAATGKVAFVLPYQANRSIQPIDRREEGALVVYRGRFAGVWDEGGRNLAPHGAAEVRVDAVTGRIVTVR